MIFFKCLINGLIYDVLVFMVIRFCEIVKIRVILILMFFFDKILVVFNFFVVIGILIIILLCYLDSVCVLFIILLVVNFVIFVEIGLLMML